MQSVFLEVSFTHFYIHFFPAHSLSLIRLCHHLHLKSTASFVLALQNVMLRSLTYYPAFLSCLP